MNEAGPADIYLALYFFIRGIYPEWWNREPKVKEMASMWHDALFILYEMFFFSSPLMSY
jgi:hypothetical protein